MTTELERLKHERDLLIEFENAVHTAWMLARKLQTPGNLYPTKLATMREQCKDMIAEYSRQIVKQEKMYQPQPKK